MKPTLYIFLRNDVESMNPGKAVAQGSHATSAFELTLQQMNDSYWNTVASKWRDGGPAGRTLVFGANGDKFFDLKNIFKREEARRLADFKDFLAGSYTDPTYPIRDGEVTHVTEFNSALWVFVYDEPAVMVEHINYARRNEDRVVYPIQQLNTMLNDLSLY